MASYELRVGGSVTQELLENLTGVVSVQPAGTLIKVSVPDEAALWGLVEALRRAGVDLLEVRREREESAGEW